MFRDRILTYIYGAAGGALVFAPAPWCSLGGCLLALSLLGAIFIAAGKFNTQ